MCTVLGYFVCGQNQCCSTSAVEPWAVFGVISVVTEFMISAAADLLQAFSVTSSIMVTE
jgi:hypothetical protein